MPMNHAINAYPFIILIIRRIHQRMRFARDPPGKVFAPSLLLPGEVIPKLR
jgi:hypothetical protein